MNIDVHGKTNNIVTYGNKGWVGEKCFSVTTSKYSVEGFSFFFYMEMFLLGRGTRVERFFEKKKEKNIFRIYV